MPIPRPSVEGILGEFRQQDYATVDGRLRTFVRTDRTLIRKTISFLCFKIEPTTMRSSFADMNMHNLRRWMKDGRRTRHLEARGTSHDLSPLHVRSERSPLHDVRQHAHADVAWTRRIACANSFLRTSWQGFAELRAKSGGARRNRTDDLLLAKQALSQLSYGPAGTVTSQSGIGGPGKI